MKNNLITASLIIILVMIVLFFLRPYINNVGNLISPGFSSNKPASSPTPTPVAPNAPKTFKFDSATDLEAELEKVNPQVLDSDFE